MAKGGFRPNAGRPKLTEAEHAERLLARKLAKRVGYTKAQAEAEAKATIAAAAAPAAPAVVADKAAKPKFARQKPPTAVVAARSAEPVAQADPVAAEPAPVAQQPAPPVPAAQPVQEPVTDQIKERVAIESAQAGMTPLDYMLHVMRSGDVDPQRRDRMAIAAAPFFHARKEPVGQGKREAADEAAKKAAGGKFGARPAPGSLKLVNGG